MFLRNLPQKKKKKVNSRKKGFPEKKFFSRLEESRFPM